VEEGWQDDLSTLTAKRTRQGEDATVLEVHREDVELPYTIKLANREEHHDEINTTSAWLTPKPPVLLPDDTKCVWALCGTAACDMRAKAKHIFALNTPRCREVVLLTQGPA
jgi:hypothetical protein